MLQTMLVKKKKKRNVSERGLEKLARLNEE